LLHLFFGCSTLFGKIEEDLQVINLLLCFMVVGNPTLKFGNQLQLFFCFVGVLPEVWSMGFFLLLFEPNFFIINVKDASSAHARA
jgi:hypothetical protein